MGTSEANIAVVRDTISYVEITNGVFQVITWQALQALDACTILVTIIDDTGQSDRHERTEPDSIVGGINGDETQHEPSSTATVKYLVIPRAAQRVGSH